MKAIVIDTITLVPIEDIDSRGVSGGSAMNTLTIRIPDDLADRLKSTAQSRGISVNKLITEINVQALTARVIRFFSS